MQMPIGQIAAATPAQAAGGAGKGVPAAAAGAAPNGAGKGFGKLLVATVGGTGSEGAGQAKQPANALAGLLGVDLSALVKESSPDALLTKLADLAEQLKADDDAKDGGQDAGALQGLLQQFDELIASILGVSLLQPLNASGPAEPANDAAQPEQSGNVSAPALATVKQQLQQALTQLSQLLEQQGGGASKALTKEQAAEAGKLLGKLDQLLKGGPQQEASQQAAPDSADAAGGAGAPVATVALLQRMGQQSAHAKFFDAGTQEPGAQTAPAEPEAASDQPVQPLWMTALQHAAEAGKAPAEAAKAAVPQVHIQQFAQEMTGMIVKQFGVTKADGLTEARISLLPENLGQVDVRIAVQNGQLTAHFTASSGTAKDMLENQLAQLRTALQSQGLQVDRLEVTQQSALQGQMFQEQRRQGSGAFRQSRQEKGKQESLDSIVQGFEKELVEQATVSGLGYGRGINVTA